MNVNNVGNKNDFDFAGSSAPTSPRTGVSTSNGNTASNSPFLQPLLDASKMNGFLGIGSGENGGSNLFDLSSSDFPSLGGSSLRQQQQQQQLQQSVQQQQLQLQQNKTNMYRMAMSASNSNFSMATEDFPALPGALSQGSLGLGNSALGSNQQAQLLSSTDNNANTNSFGNNGFVGTGTTSSGGINLDGLNTSSGIYNDSSNTNNNLNNNSSNTLGVPMSNSANSVTSTLIGGLGGQPAPTPSANSNSSISRPVPQQTTTTANSNSAVSGSTALSSEYGLLGLLAVIRMSEADRNALALGCDLTALGLDLQKSGRLASSFASPFSESPATRELHYQLPMCYYMQPPALKTGHLSKFQLETLFYIFYALPKDVLQAYSAQELYSRDWRYHTELKLWFKRAGPSDGVPTNVGGNQFIYFDINTWERRLFVSGNNINQNNITSGLLSEEEVRVKFPSS